jgi:transcriptional regulator with XRE-family HTH domain
MRGMSPLDSLKAGASELTDSLGERLRDLRVSRGLSRRALARTLGVSDTYLLSLEKGHIRPSEARCRQLAAALGVPDDSLYAAAGVIPADVRRKLCEDASRLALVRAL